MALEVIIGILGLAGACFFFWTGFSIRSQAQQVDQSGVEGQATIISRKTVGFRDRSYYVTFQFDAQWSDGKNITYTHEEEVPYKAYNKLTEQSKVTIRYLPASPGDSARLAGTYSTNRDSTSMFAYGVGCLIGGLAVIGITLSSSVPALQPQVPAATYAFTPSTDLSIVQSALKPYMAQWEANKTVADHFVTPASIGLGNVTQEQIVYGYCSDNTFYVYVPEGFREGSASGIFVSDAYSYTLPSDDETCTPNHWLGIKRADLSDGWFLATLTDLAMTETPAPQ